MRLEVSDKHTGKIYIDILALMREYLECIDIT